MLAGCQNNKIQSDYDVITKKVDSLLNIMTLEKIDLIINIMEPI